MLHVLRREQLLQLPHNSAAFALLQDRGLHPAYKGLAQQMQAGSGGVTTTLANRLAACLSQLAHWCPLFGELPPSTLALMALHTFHYSLSLTHPQGCSPGNVKPAPTLPAVAA